MRANTQSLSHVTSARTVARVLENPAPAELDAADSLTTLMLPEGFIADAEALVAADADAITREGCGKTVRRILGVEIGVRRMNLRAREAVFGAVFEQCAHGGGDPARLRVFDDLIAREHARLLASVGMLQRTSGGNGQTIVAVRAHQAAVSIGREAP